MSYDIDTCKIKKMENLVIPLAAFYEYEREDWHPKEPILDRKSGEMVLHCGCGQEIRGYLKDGFLEITKLSLCGEGSGSFMNYVLEGALRKSTGELEMVMIWEGGDSVTKMTVLDGIIEETGVEL